MRKEDRDKNLLLAIAIWYATIQKRGYFDYWLDYKECEQWIMKQYPNIKKTIIHKAFWHYVKEDINFLAEFEY